MTRATDAVNRAVSNEPIIIVTCSGGRIGDAVMRGFGSYPGEAVLLRIAGVYDDECHSIPISQQIERIY